MNPKYFPIFLVSFIFLHYLHYFDYINYDYTLGGNICKIIGLFLLLFYLRYNFNVNQCPSKKYILGFIFLPMLSFISCYIEHGQSIIESMRAYIPLFVFFIYFYLHKNKLPAKYIIIILTIFAVARTSILIIEQFTYPNYLFAFRPEVYDDYGNLKQIEIRSGIYRYYISDTYLSQFLIFYYFQKITEHFNSKEFLLFVFGLVGLYLDQSRQFMVTTIMAVIIITLLSSNFKHKKASLVFITILGIIIYFNVDILFGSLIEQTTSDMTKDNIRVMSYYTYFSDYWGGFLSYIFGNGIPGNSAYGAEISSMETDYGLWRADIGIVGFFNQYGIVSVVFFFYFYLNFLRKKWNLIESHLKMFFVASFLNLPLVVFFVNNDNWYVFWALMMYLLDSSIKHNREIRTV